MNWNDILDEIIRGLQPEHIPVEYITKAKITDQNGIEHVLRGDELARFMDDPERANARDARVFLDVRKIRKAMNDEIVRFFDHLASRLQSDD